MDSVLVPLVDLGPVQHQNVRSPSGYMNCTANQHQLPEDESRSDHVQAGQTQLYYNTVYQGQMQPSNVYSNQGQMMQNPNTGSVNYPPTNLLHPGPNAMAATTATVDKNHGERQCENDAIRQTEYKNKA